MSAAELQPWAGLLRAGAGLCAGLFLEQKQAEQILGGTLCMQCPSALALAQVSSAGAGTAQPLQPGSIALLCREEAKIDARSETCSLGKARVFLNYCFPLL